MSVAPTAPNGDWIRDEGLVKNTSSVLPGIRKILIRLTDMERQLGKVQASQTEMEHMLKFFISYYWDTGEELTPATLTFRVIGTLRFILAIKMLHQGHIDTYKSVILMMESMQLVKDWWFAKVVKRNRILVEEWVRNPDNQYLKQMVGSAMDYTRGALLRYLAIMLLPLSYLWYRGSSGSFQLPKFTDILSCKSYYLAVTEVMCNWLLVAVFYTDEQRLSWRYVSLKYMLESALGAPPNMHIPSQ